MQLKGQIFRKTVALLVLLIFGCGSALASVGPVMLGSFASRIDSWSLTTPHTIFGFEKFGVRRGAYNLHITQDGKSVDIPIRPRYIANLQASKDPLAKWNVEKDLTKIAELNGSQPLMLSYSAEGNGIIQVQKVELAANSSVQPSGDQQEALKYLMGGITPPDSPGEIYVDLETMSLVGLFMVLLIPAYLLMLFSKNTLQKAGQ
jgi:hypothetical protein